MESIRRWKETGTQGYKKTSDQGVAMWLKRKCHIQFANYIKEKWYF